MCGHCEVPVGLMQTHPSGQALACCQEEQGLHAVGLVCLLAFSVLPQPLHKLLLPPWHPPLASCPSLHFRPLAGHCSGLFLMLWFVAQPCCWRCHPPLQPPLQPRKHLRRATRSLLPLVFPSLPPGLAVKALCPSIPPSLCSLLPESWLPARFSSTCPGQPLCSRIGHFPVGGTEGKPLFGWLPPFYGSTFPECFP